MSDTCADFLVERPRRVLLELDWRSVRSEGGAQNPGCVEQAQFRVPARTPCPILRDAKSADSDNSPLLMP